MKRIALALAATVWIVSTGFTLTPYYIKFDGLDGEAVEKGFENYIYGYEFEYSVISPTDAASGLPTGRRQHKPVVIVKSIDKTTPDLYQSLLNNHNFPQVEIAFVRADGVTARQETFQTIVLRNARITSWKQRIIQFDTERTEYANSGVDEELQLIFEEIELTFVPDAITATDSWEPQLAKGSNPLSPIARFRYANGVYDISLRPEAVVKVDLVDLTGRNIASSVVRGNEGFSSRLDNRSQGLYIARISDINAAASSAIALPVNIR